MYATVQILGSLLVLAAFVAGLSGRLSTTGVTYLAMNAAGSGVLATDAVIGREWGFLLLEGVWSLVSLHSLLRKAILTS